MTMPGFSADAAVGRLSGYRRPHATTAGPASVVAPASSVLCSDYGCTTVTTPEEYLGYGALIGGGIGAGGGVVGAGIGAVVGAIGCLFDSDCHF